MAKRKQLPKQRSRPKRLTRNTTVTLIAVLIALAALVFTDSVPEILKPYIPEELQPVFFPKAEISMSKIQANTSNESFDKSKRVLMKMYAEAGQFTEFYCGSTFDAEGNLDHSRSGFRFRTNEKRANRIEWEHIVPAEAFGQAFKAWRQGDPACVDSKGQSFEGRECAEKVNAEFRLMQADMYNLVPAIGEVNGDRSNYSYAMLAGEAREYGACNMEIRDRKAEPPDNRFGDIARTYWYMNSAYPGYGIVSNKNVKLFEAWNTMDPVDAWECRRNREIAQLQGNVNRIVREACAAAGL